MRYRSNLIFALLITILCQIGIPSFSQLGFSFDIKKPTQYDDRVLESEKSEQKKFTLPRRIAQNTFTHYNYFFNASNKLNSVIEKAKSTHEDDFSQLLSFYNYSLDETAENVLELDSIITKTTTGIVLHDLRNDWVDNMYLLMGAAYYFRKQFDSAALTFQFINYAFAAKEKDGYAKPIGANLNDNIPFSISTNEKRGVVNKVLKVPPSRNDAIIWLTRTFLAENNFAEAASLIATLKNDPFFPKRLTEQLEEVQAFLFYKNNMNDSAALHLSKALKSAPTKNERARWEFLTAQLYEKSGDYINSKLFFERAINNTTNPVLEIYARLHSIRSNKAETENYIDRNIGDLVKMVKLEKYAAYRDIIYFTIAQIELEKNNVYEATNYLNKSIAFNTDNLKLKNQAFLQLAELSFAEKDYTISRDNYDSIKLNDPNLKTSYSLIERKETVSSIAAQIEIIERQYNLLKIAAMPEEERITYIKNLVKEIRKQQGLQDETPTLIPIGEPTSQTDLFTLSSGKTEWYFYNSSLRTKGFSEFKTRWGNRSNVDGWRRLSSITSFQNNINSNPIGSENISSTNTVQEISFDALMETIPLNEAKQKITNDSIANAFFILGKKLIEEISDYSTAIFALENLKTRSPFYEKIDEATFLLFYCYKKTDNLSKTNEMQTFLQTNFPNSNFTAIVTTGKNPIAKSSNNEATRLYENIYSLFIEGNYSQAFLEKAIADSLYGSHYWTPQLLYIEAVYFIKQKQDGNALRALAEIIALFPNSPLAEKAAQLSDILKNRTQIEYEINAIKIQEEKKIETVETKTPVKNELPKIIKTEPIALKKIDSLAEKIITPNFSLVEIDKNSVLILLHNVDPVWVTEAKNAFFLFNRSKFNSQLFDLSIIEINKEYKAIVISNFNKLELAADYVRTIKPVSQTQIIPWLKADKYSYTIISATNLELLKQKKEPLSYQKFAEEQFSGKF